jgi:hypothetical protein
MSLTQFWNKIQSRSVTKILAVFVISGLIFVVISPFFNQLGLTNSSMSKIPTLGEGKLDYVTEPNVVGPRHYSFLPLAFVIKPLAYVGIFLLIYFLFFDKKPKINISLILLELAFVLILFVFVFSLADLARVGLNYYWKGADFGQSVYLYEYFARQLASRISAALISFPVFVYLNLKLIKKDEIKEFSLILAFLLGLFSLILFYFLLNAVFLLILGVSGASLANYAFPIAYFFVLFPLSLAYSLVYLRKK